MYLLIIGIFLTYTTTMLKGRCGPDQSLPDVSLDFLSVHSCSVIYIILLYLSNFDVKSIEVYVYSQL